MLYCLCCEPEDFNINYTQCLLTKDNKSQVAWIPSNLAQKGSIVRIKRLVEWDDGWKVTATYASRLGPPPEIARINRGRKKRGKN